MGLLRFIFIAVIVLWVIRLLVRLILPTMVRSAFGGNQNQQQYSQSQQTYNRKSEGVISILSAPKKEKKGNSDKLGEFVDYEEVK